MDREAEAGNRCGEFGAGRYHQRRGLSGDVCPGQIYRWRKELQAAPAGFAEMLIVPAATMASEAGTRSTCCSEPAIKIEFAEKVRVRIPAAGR